MSAHHYLRGEASKRDWQCRGMGVQSSATKALDIDGGSAGGSHEGAGDSLEKEIGIMGIMA